MRHLIFTLIFITSAFFLFGQQSDFSHKIVEDKFNVVKSLCDKDNGNLWGVNLWGPIIIVDKNTRTVIANQQDSAGIMEKSGNLFYGKCPDDMIIANSTINLWGTYWAMVSVLPSDVYLCNSIFIHESFHRAQSEIGLADLRYANNHLDKTLARILLKLEWSALELSVNVAGDSHKEIIDALTFRYYRRSFFPGSDTMENKFEVHEGLAEYTANKLCSSSEQELKEHLISKHNDYWAKESLVRSFGYYSGFLYAYLLDKADINWRNSINSYSDLGLILKDSLHIILPQDLEVAYNSIKETYGYSGILSNESDMAKRKDSLICKYRSDFIINPVVRIPLNDAKFSFNVNNIQPVDSIGNVYESINISDIWGRLIVESEGCLITNDWKYAIVPAQKISIEDKVIRGSMWKLILNGNYEIAGDGSDYIIKIK